MTDPSTRTRCRLALRRRPARPLGARGPRARGDAAHELDGPARVERPRRGAQARGRHRRSRPQPDLALPRVWPGDGRRGRAAGDGGHPHLLPERDEGPRQEGRQRRGPADATSSHGNGWPSAYGPFQERTKNGLGLNPMEGPARRATSSTTAPTGCARTSSSPRRRRHPQPSLVRVRQRVVGHAHPVAVGRGPARRQLRERLPRHRGPYRVGARLAAGSGRHPPWRTTTPRWMPSS